MNKLYVIRFLLSSGYCVSTYNAWSEEDVVAKMNANPEWEFTLVENNGTHKIWEAR